MKTIPQAYSYVVGTDVAKESLDVCLIRVADKQLCYQKFNNNMQGFQKMKHWLKSYGCELEKDTLFLYGTHRTCARVDWSLI